MPVQIDMDMPESCEVCEMFCVDLCLIMNQQAEANFDKARPLWCPLKEVK